MPDTPDLWTAPAALVLASGSATRLAALRALGLRAECVPPQVDERAREAEYLASGGDLAGLAACLARAKALEVGRRRPAAICLGADQTLTSRNATFHRSATLAEAAANLAKLAGQTHALVSAACVVRDGEVLFELQDQAHLTMRRLSAGQIQAYLDAAGPAALASVGGYQIEALGLHLFERVAGDHATILGLPLLALLSRFRALGYVAL